MTTLLERLESIRTNTLAQLDALTNSDGTPSGTAGSLPNKSGDGINVDHDGHEAKLWARLEKIEARIAAIQGPFEIESGVDVF